MAAPPRAAGQALSYLNLKFGVLLYLLYFRLKNEEHFLREKGLLKKIEEVVKRT